MNQRGVIRPLIIRSEQADEAGLYHGSLHVPRADAIATKSVAAPSRLQSVAFSIVALRASQRTESSSDAYLLGGEMASATLRQERVSIDGNRRR